MSPLPPSRSSSPKRNLSEAQNYIAVLEDQIIYYRERCKALNRQLLAAKEESQCGAIFVEKSNRHGLERYRKSCRFRTTVLKIGTSVNMRKKDAKRLKIHKREGASTSNNYLTISSQNRSSNSDELDIHVHSPVQELCETAHSVVSGQNRSAQNYIAVLEKQIIYYQERCKALNRQILAAKEESQCGAIFVEESSRRGSKLYRKSVNMRKSDAKRLKIHKREGASTSNNYLTISSQNRTSNSKPDRNVQDALIAFVGKGVTFDAGGISLKPATHMDEMRANMNGAACVVASIKAAAELKLKVNIERLIPLTENHSSGSAIKPGDLVTAMNEKIIIVDNTDTDRRLILDDALCYAAEFKPKVTLDIATLTGAMDIEALEAAAPRVFSSSTELSEVLRAAATATGDHVWRITTLQWKNPKRD